MDNEQTKSKPDVTDVETEHSQHAINKERDWRDRLLDMNFFSPLYIFTFIVLFKDGKDGYDLHDAIIKFISTYNG